MSALSIASAMRGAGTTSVREMFRRNNVADTSLANQTRRAIVHNFYEANGGLRGAFGVPIGPVNVSGTTALASFAGGRVRLTSDGPQGERITVVRVRFVGLHCNKESDWDHGSGSDEPYFIIGVAGANGSRTMRFNYKDVNKGSNRFEAADIVGEDAEITPPIVLVAFGVEHDHGSRAEAEGKVRKAIEKAEKTLDSVGAAISAMYGVAPTNHVMPEWMRDIVVGWGPEAATALFGLADDEIGKKPIVMFDNSAELEAWLAPAVLGRHGDNEYNVKLNIDGGDEGNYDLFFLVDLADITLEWRKRAQV